MDVDGVLTDGRVYLLENGRQARAMHVRDGYALQLAVKKGYPVAVISGAEEAAVRERLERLGLTEIHLGILDKAAVLNTLMSRYGLKPEEVLFMGDDMPDIAALALAGLKACPADAVPEIREMADYISPVSGGQGCVRDVIEKILKLNDHWESDTSVASR